MEETLLTMNLIAKLAFAFIAGMSFSTGIFLSVEAFRPSLPSKSHLIIKGSLMIGVSFTLVRISFL